jgi:hypothetical protein
VEIQRNFAEQKIQSWSSHGGGLVASMSVRMTVAAGLALSLLSAPRR